MSKIVGAVHKGIVRLSASVLASLFVSPAFQTLLKHFAAELEPLLMVDPSPGKSFLHYFALVTHPIGISARHCIVATDPLKQRFQINLANVGINHVLFARIY